jgi:diguanylate cyclase (GGDEF)-like protein/PAS domain S-box-containing protein
VRLDPRYILDDEPRRSELAVPIVHDDRVIGVIDSEHSQSGFYTEKHMAMMIIIASMASSRIATALTIERLNETVAELEQARNALRDEERRYRELYNQHPSMFFSVDREARIISTNDYAVQELGLPRSRIESRMLSDLIRPGGTQSILEQVAVCISNPSEVHRFEGSIIDTEGQETWLRLTARALATPNESAGSVLIVAEDITATRDLSLELEFNASHDWLTGLYNRREFERQVKAAMNDGRAHGIRHVFCFIDLDQFKVVNDTCGHSAGDALLRHIARCFEDHVRKSDVVGRIGGDEFGILMRNCTLPDAKMSVSTLIATISKDPFHWNSHVFSVGASAGLRAVDEVHGPVDEVFATADAACMSAKEHGRNRVHVYRERSDDVAKRKGESRWIYRIARALSENAFELHYQPMQPLSDAAGSSPHAEILLRMRDEDNKLVFPDAFIPAAERYGFAVRLDQWVVGQAFEWIVGVGHHVQPDSIWSINLSGASIGDYEFLEFLTDRLCASGVSPKSLCFEITETAAIADLVRARRFIEQLKERGCRFALDDFGIGLSSLSYLKTFPVDFLKIDGAFISDMNEDPVNMALVRSINDIGHLTNKKTIAEYVHNEAVLRSVQELGVDFAQGNFIAKPRPLSEFARDGAISKI